MIRTAPDLYRAAAFPTCGQVQLQWGETGRVLIGRVVADRAIMIRQKGSTELQRAEHYNKRTQRPLKDAGFFGIHHLTDRNETTLE